ncbi:MULTISPECIES: ATP-binding protein [unclassified Streptomyces]|uniref:HAMP domain-containing sensor histidine kinase n=1 Tax=unclassified Streptomyces TaxID=2593676 RepID=UPI0006FDA251|nr:MULTISPECIES: ATP-binding protein [unclassified Streptomyces]KQX49574.1 histidine kinase [Streptomyces sp. Root1304]KRA79193.1 histidine kinase [Streptomyces sp. Root66D1]
MTGDQGYLGSGSTIRTRIALVYGGVFLVLGTVLLLVVNLLVLAGTDDETEAIVARANGTAGGMTGASGGGSGGGVAFVGASALGDDISRAAGEQMLMWSGLALLVMACCAVVVGWWTAGRVLRPVHEMTARARRLSERTLHDRIAVRGPDDELKELGDTIDALLGRLETAFDSQRRFIANASHELRTPLATQRAAIQVGLDEDCGVRQVLLDANRRSERLIDGLLLLARSERGLAERDDVRLGEVVTEEYADACVSDGGGVVRGSRVLLGQLVRNLVANAVAYNVPGGTVDVRVEGGVLTVANTGPVVPADQVEALFEPFRRGEGRDRTGPGAGLGLSIVRSIAVAHGGGVRAVARGAEEGGGLAVTVTLPVTATAPGSRS